MFANKKLYVAGYFGDHNSDSCGIVLRNYDI